jgi:hypothetical protein
MLCWHGRKHSDKTGASASVGIDKGEAGASVQTQMLVKRTADPSASVLMNNLRMR